MVICKYYRQGNCRYGQYCQFEHVNNFGNKTEYNEDDIAVTVAKEVLLAERGGQWLLSCFGPLRDRPCIPGMEDLSPDEVRWEMYQAQKNGMVEQAKIHFQQLCQDMKAKREALKNPTRETITMLKKILGSGQKAPQLGLTNSMSNNNVFGSTTFGVQSNNNNPFGGGFTSSSASSIFGKSTNPVFGGTATFGNNLGVFGNSGTSGQTSSIFGATSTSTSFSGAQTNTLAFGTAQNNSVFGGSSQNVFGQSSNVFGTNQLGNASSGSLFSNPLTSQANTSIFGGATTTTASLFGGDTSSTGLQTNSVFGGAPTTMSGGIFSQPKTSAFGGTLGFGGGTTSYASTSGNSIFGGNQTFGAASTSSIFGGSTLTTTPAFGAPIATTSAAFDLTQQQSSTNTFGATSAPNVFGMQNTDTSMNNNPSFGTPAATISNPFVTSSQQINSTSTISTPFANTGLSIAAANNTFATTGTSSNSIFASAATTFATSNATVPKNSPFAASTFGNASASSSPFDSTKTSLAGTTLANPFAPRTQQIADSPFGSVTQNQTSSPFGRLFNAPANDDSVYSAEGALTDEEKEMYLAQRFIIGKIPVKPPTKDMR
ncbi:nuclear pore complex protein DDB_G0274915-like isoform X2 [Pseudomyrmex gracilis]|uniref:nuclear pore complex protein DDB_G0274915-like isoform X2 n=1 Tax=Pseudomyrmex gracilis TaxID=219809 RepID=UPI0009953C65|nr:nuclear pore complex protein DDB_G0274915-like isoform X2 [Pseudomyrmex gracilis]